MIVVSKQRARSHSNIRLTSTLISSPNIIKRERDGHSANIWLQGRVFHRYGQVDENRVISVERTEASGLSCTFVLDLDLSTT